MVLVVALMVGCWAEGDGGSQTHEEVCVAVAEPFCWRVAECAGRSVRVYEDCAAEFMDACCARSSSCDRKVAGVPEGVWYVCADAIDQMSCERARDGELPDACLLP